MSAKSALRSKVLKERELLSAGEVRFRSEKIANQFLKLYHRWFPRGVSTAGVYFPIRGEVDCRPIAAILRNQGVKLALPRITAFNSQAKAMHFYPFSDWEELTTAILGLREPQAREGDVPLRPDLLIVPGTAFSLNRDRIGYGAGFYDRYLSEQTPKPKTIGLAYNFQLIDPWPIAPESHDVALDAVLTEEKTITG